MPQKTAKKTTAKKAAQKTTPRKTAKKAVKKVAKKAPKKITQKDSKKTAKIAVKKNRAAAPSLPTYPSLEDINHAAFLNFMSRVECGIYGDERGDWLAAEASLKVA